MLIRYYAEVTIYDHEENYEEMRAWLFARVPVGDFQSIPGGGIIARLDFVAFDHFIAEFRITDVEGKPVVPA